MSESLKPTEPQRSLGRVYMPNPGSQYYPLREALTRSALRASNWKTKRWQLGSGLGFQNQGWTSRCVEYGCTHILMLEGTARRDAFELTKGLYEWAQENDYWPGGEPTYYGTSVDAGLQFLLHQANLISEYRWVRTMDDVLARLSANIRDGGGPIVVGTDWYSSMDSENGIWSPEGSYRGGHCYTLIGHLSPTSKRTRKIICGNSHEGNYIGTMDADAMEWLLFAQNGEGAALTELKK